MWWATHTRAMVAFIPTGGSRAAARHLQHTRCEMSNLLHVKLGFPEERRQALLGKIQTVQANHPRFATRHGRPADIHRRHRRRRRCRRRQRGVRNGVANSLTGDACWCGREAGRRGRSGGYATDGGADDSPREHPAVLSLTRPTPLSRYWHPAVGRHRITASHHVKGVIRLRDHDFQLGRR